MLAVDRRVDHWRPRRSAHDRVACQHFSGSLLRYIFGLRRLVSRTDGVLTAPEAHPRLSTTSWRTYTRSPTLEQMAAIG